MSNIDWEYDNGNLRVGDTVYSIREWCDYWHVGCRSRLVQKGYSLNEIKEIYNLIEWLAKQEENNLMERRELEEIKRREAVDMIDPDLVDVSRMQDDYDIVVNQDDLLEIQEKTMKNVLKMMKI